MRLRNGQYATLEQVKRENRIKTLSIIVVVLGLIILSTITI